MENTQMAVLCALMAAAVVLLAVVLVRQRHHREEAAEQARRQEQLINEVADEMADRMNAAENEQLRTLSDLTTSLTGTMTAMGQTQSSQLDALQRQGMLASQAQEERGGRLQSAVSQSMGQIDLRMEQLRQSVDSSMNALRQDNDRQLSEMRRTVDDQLSEHLDRKLTESFAQVSDRLEQVWKGLGEMQTLAAGVGDLKKVLTNVKTRGIWGEMQLGSLLADMLAPGQFETNVAVVPGSSERVEFAIRLPGRDGSVVYLPVDAKFPQEDYLRLTAAREEGDTSAAEEARRALMNRLKQEARRIASKYISPPYTTDFAILFLPVEGLYAEAVQDMGTVETIQREQRVVVAGPSTFAAMLNALQMGFRTLAIEQRSGEVWRLLGAVKTDFGRFAETLERTQQRLQQASDSIDQAVTRSQSIQRRLSRMEDAGEPFLPQTDEEEE